MMPPPPIFSRVCGNNSLRYVEMVSLGVLISKSLRQNAYLKDLIDPRQGLISLTLSK
jgi:hypothetical protein